MVRARERIGWLGIVALAATGLAGAPSAAGEARFDPARVQWEKASYHGRKLFVSLQAEVELLLPSPREKSVPLPSTLGSEDLDPDAQRRTMAVRLESSLRGGRTTTVLHLDAADAAALQRRETRFKGDRTRRKTLRFAERGVAIEAHRPAPGESLDEPESWSEVTRRFEPYTAWIGDQLEITEPTALFYILAAARLAEPGEVIRLPALSKSRIIMMELEVAGWEQIEVAYERDGERVEGRVPALKILVDGRDVDPTSEESPLELLGMRGAVDVYLDAETRAPLLIAGRVPYVGRAEVHLRSLTTR